jgi:cell division protein FtsI/penicillin-binding protein 2
MVGAIMLGIVCVLARVVQLKLEPDPRMIKAIGSPFSSRPQLARRGDIVDRRGRIIATTTIGYRLFVDPQVVADPQTVAVDITTAVGGDPTAIDRAILARPESRYVVVRELLEPWQAEAIERASLRGVCVEPRPVRHYPYGDLAAGIIGKVGFEHTGLAGIEHRFNRILLARGGQLRYLRDAAANPLWIDPADYEPAFNGDPVCLSIDLVVQEIVERRLARAVEDLNAGGARSIVLDARTGEILAMHDVLRTRPAWDDQIEDPLRTIDAALGRNRCVTDPYEPGSTFKPFIWSVATALGRADPEEMLDTPTGGGHRTSYGRNIRDSHYYGPSTWRKVLVKSMNSGMAIVAERMSPAEMQEAIARFGFGRRTPCGIAGQSPGLITPPSEWSRYTQSSVSFGHEIAVTPVQMARAFSAFARDGTMPTLRITAVPDRERELRFIQRVLPSSIARQTREVMRDVMHEGTGRGAQSDRYELFGKSGTAQLPLKEGGGYHEDRYVSSFIAGAPYVSPRIVVLCVIDDPDRERGHQGGADVGPIVRDIVDETLTYLGVPPDKEAAEIPALARAE